MEKNELDESIKVQDKTEIEDENSNEKTETSENDKNSKKNKEIVVNEESVSEDKKSKKSRLLLKIVVFIIFLGLLVSTIFSLVNINNTRIINGVFIKDFDVSNLEIDEAKNKLEEISKIDLKNEIELKYKDFNITISPEQIDAYYDINTAVNAAYEVGRKDNIILNNYVILNTLINHKYIDLKLLFNEEKLNNLILDLEKKLPDSVKERSYYIEGDSLKITKGTYGSTIKKEELKDKIVYSIKSKDEKIIEIPVEFREPYKISIDEIYSEIYTEPKNAYYETNPFKIYTHVNGVDFAIDLEEARKLIEEEKEEYIIPLKFTEPEITTSKIGTEAFPDLLASFSTKYDASNTNRSTNIRLAAEKVNGVVLMPGEVFSYNKIVGKRSPEAGYKLAGVYENGRVVNGYGGGICQLSSTLYNAAVLSNLEILERKNHQFVTSYVSAGRDATVNYGTIDFQFRNSRKYPIKVICSVENGICEVKIFGAKEDVEYIVKIESKVTGSIPYTTKYEENPNMYIGEEKVIQHGANGCRSIAYKILILNGNVVSQEVLSEDTYSAMNKIIQRGTKGSTVVKTEGEETE